MGLQFGNIPHEVKDYIRDIFANANDEVSNKVNRQPHLHEETLDQIFISELSGLTTRSFVSGIYTVEVETHFLGARRMFERWEIADIAIAISIRNFGRLSEQKVALLQTKRLYANESAGRELEEADFAIGIGRLIDQEHIIPPRQQGTYTFDQSSGYNALTVPSEQHERIREYIKQNELDVYYAFYNPTQIPHSVNVPSPIEPDRERVSVGLRVHNFDQVDGVSGDKPVSPTYQMISHSRQQGWKIENFVADELLVCREGNLIHSNKRKLRNLLYRRSAPITAAISITLSDNEFD